jgi:hypothetical protein
MVFGVVHTFTLYNAVRDGAAVKEKRPMVKFCQTTSFQKFKMDSQNPEFFLHHFGENTR